MDEKIYNGGWWTGKKATPIKCSRCGALHRQRPSVIRYLPHQDVISDWERKYPGVTEKGWVLWARCTRRGIGYRDKYYFEAVGDQAVKSWETRCNGWSRH